MRAELRAAGERVLERSRGEERERHRHPEPWLGVVRASPDHGAGNLPRGHRVEAHRQQRSGRFDDSDELARPGSQGARQVAGVRSPDLDPVAIPARRVEKGHSALVATIR